MDIANKVILVTEQSMNAVEATNALISNINGSNTEKYIFVCNKFKKEDFNALISSEKITKFTVNEYVDYFSENGYVSCENLSQKAGIRKVSFLVI